MICAFFFFKQKTAYEMRISDWSSDVCSSDLGAQLAADDRHQDRHRALVVVLQRSAWHVRTLFLHAATGRPRPLARYWPRAAEISQHETASFGARWPRSLPP